MEFNFREYLAASTIICKNCLSLDKVPTYTAGKEFNKASYDSTALAISK
jgi:hypothetical protein